MTTTPDNLHDTESRETSVGSPMRLPPGEIANTITHGVGLLLSVVGSSVLIRMALQHGDLWRLVGCLIFSASLVCVYAASTISHAVAEPKRRHFFRTLDQAAIYLLIVGTFTPFSLAYLQTGWWWAFLFRKRGTMPTSLRR